MKSFKEIALLLGIVAFIFTGQVRSQGDELQKAFDSLPDNLKTLFNGLGDGNLLKYLMEVADCVKKLAGPFDVCNFKTSVDPFFYISKCAEGTGLATFINNTIGRLQQLEVPFAVPLAVSKDRCYTGIPPLPLPFTLPPITTLSVTVPSVTPISPVIPGVLGR